VKHDASPPGVGVVAHIAVRDAHDQQAAEPIVRPPAILHSGARQAQLEQIVAAVCERMFCEFASDAGPEPKKHERLLSTCGGDVVVVTRIDQRGDPPRTNQQAP
jgi:hypothetical protein